MSTTPAAQEITAHGAVVTVTTDGVGVRRSPMAQALLPSEYSFSPAELRGWYRQAPTALSPGWIQFSLDSPAPGSVNRPVRGYPATHGATNVVPFAPGQHEEFTRLHQLLTNLQSGVPLDATAPTAPAAPTAPSASAAAPADKTTEQRGGESAEKTSDKATSGAPQQTWQRVATPDTVPEANTEADANGPIFGENVTLTGDFAPYEKGEVWDMIAEAGATVGKNVTKKTTVLVIGEWGSVTSKEKRARELQDKGQEITLWSFDEFLTALGKSRRPDLEDVKGTSAPF